MLFCNDEFKMKIKNILFRDDFCNTLKKLNIINTPLPVGTEVIEARRVTHFCGTTGSRNYLDEEKYYY